MFLSWLVFFNVHLWLLSLRFCISYDSVTSSVSRSLIYSDLIRHLLAHNADTHCHIVSSVSGGVEACCSSSFPFGLSPVVGVFIPFIQLEHTVSFVRSVYEAAYEEIILSSWRGNEEITHWDDITCLPEGKQKKDIYIIVIFWLFFGLSVSCWFKKLSRCGTLPWGPSCGANHFRGLLRSAWPLDWPIYPGGGGQFTQVELRQRGDSALRWHVFLQSKLSE